MKNLAQLREYPRTYFDVDATELADALIDAWLYEADVRITEATASWPHWEHTESLTIVSGTHTYDVPTTFRSVHTVEGEDGPLVRMSRRAALERYETYGSSTVSTARPRVYSIYADEIRVWPTPDAGYTFTITGIRKRDDWLAGGSGATPDLPAEFEPALLSWVMHRAYMHQDDPEMADRERERFQELLSSLLATESQGDGGEIVIGGERTVQRAYDGRMKYPWE